MKTNLHSNIRSQQRSARLLLNLAALTTAALLAATLAPVSSTAAPLSFDFKDPKSVNNVQFKLDAPLESITGTATGISGQVTFDPDAPAATTGRIVLSTTTLTVGNPMMAEHLHSANWLDVAQYPEIVFEAVKLDSVTTDGAKTTANVSGKLTIKGITKDIVVPVTLTHLPDKLGARLGNAKLKGDLLVLRANFEINRSDYNIQPGQNTDKVAETIHLSLSIAGAAQK
ncbi:YceI family protein [Opitutaceae bacterium TAV4]|nr:YceI family protein [Opitutaceae bacterium TAV4]RRK01721.1 YceI family protein [Opitutaceae bacterium TAV3]